MMASIVMHTMLMSSTVHQHGNYSLIPSTMVALVLLISASMQGCHADHILLEDAKNTDVEKVPGVILRLKKSTKSSKSNKNTALDVGDDIPRLGDWYADNRNKVHLVVGMSDNGQLFADTNHFYEYHEFFQSWKSLSPEPFTDYGILDLNGNGQDVLVGKHNDIEGVMSLELRKCDEVKGKGYLEYFWRRKYSLYSIKTSTIFQ